MLSINWRISLTFYNLSVKRDRLCSHRASRRCIACRFFQRISGAFATLCRRIRRVATVQSPRNNGNIAQGTVNVIFMVFAVFAPKRLELFERMRWAEKFAPNAHTFHLASFLLTCGINCAWRWRNESRRRTNGRVCICNPTWESLTRVVCLERA